MMDNGHARPSVHNKDDASNGWTHTTQAREQNAYDEVKKDVSNAFT